MKYNKSESSSRLILELLFIVDPVRVSPRYPLLFLKGGFITSDETAKASLVSQGVWYNKVRYFPVQRPWVPTYDGYLSNCVSTHLLCHEDTKKTLEFSGL